MAVSSDYDDAPALRAKINGPTSLKEALLNHPPNRFDTVELLAGEAHRIRRALIASFLHPNTAGDRQFANMAVGRYDAHRLAIANLPAHGLPVPSFPGGPESLQARLSRFGLRGQGPLQADVGHEFVDAIMVTVSTSPSSDRDFVLDLYLLLVLREVVGGHHKTIALQLNMRHYFEFAGQLLVGFKKFHPQLEPNRTDEFSIDVSGHTLEGQLLLKDLIGMKLFVGDSEANQTWLPEDLTVDINGVQVLTRDLRGKRLGRRGSVDLAYPDPVQVDTPVLAPTAVRIDTVPQSMNRS